MEIDGRTLSVSNLEKVLFPEVAFTKAQVIDYYVRVAPVLLPHLAGRPVTFTRWPDGVEGQTFFEKNSARHAPEWVRRVTIPSPGSSTGRETLDMVVLESVADLAWAANLAALELHVPQWQVDDDGVPQLPDLLVLDLDPGPRPGLAECCAVAERLGARLEADGLDPVVKTSGSKGMQVYAPIESRRPGAPQPVRQGAGPGALRRDAGRRRLADGEGAAPGQGAHRLEPEQPGEDHGRAVLAAGPGRRDGVHADRLGRGRRGARGRRPGDAALHAPTTSWRGWRSTATCSTSPAPGGAPLPRERASSEPRFRRRSDGSGPVVWESRFPTMSAVGAGLPDPRFADVGGWSSAAPTGRGSSPSSAG